jgi:AcrR family transcriptional regulator
METLVMKSVSIVLAPLKIMKERIIQGAAELFLRYGIRSISMDDIAAHLSISKKTIYQFFREKDEIVNEVVRLEIASDLRIMQEIAANASDALDEIMNAMDAMKEILSRMNPNMVYDVRKYHLAAWKMFTRFREVDILQIVESNLKKGIREGIYQPENDVKVLARLRVEEIEMGFNPRLFPPAQFSLHQVEMELLRHFLSGILTAKGMKLLVERKLNQKQKKTKAIA